ncbi:MAG TPA: DNA polymerase III subunit delta, partial [Methylophilaceae bacterium]|nr:DNA polymerase III subunit delta [Methylophilaceae bacterium]
MRLQPQQLKQHLEQGLKPLYVLTGDEPLAQRECLDELRRAARDSGVDERASLTVDRYFNWQQISAFGQSISLFASQRLLEISIPSGKPGVEGSKVLQALAAKPIEDTVVIIILPKIDWKDQKSAWYSSLEQSSVFLVLQEIGAQQLPQWIAKRLAAQNQQTDAATLEFIAHQVEGNLLAAHQEIQKLGLLYPEGVLAGEAVREAVLNVSRYDAFQLGEAVLAGDSERTVRILQGLQDEGAQPVAVMNPLLWVLGPLVKIKQAEARGESISTVMQQARIYGDRQNLVKHAVTRLSMRQLQAALFKLAEIDKTAKGLLKGDAWLEISRLCFGLARIGV